MPEPYTASESNPHHVAEPVTIRMYGFKEITLPTYLLWFLVTILVVAVLIAASYEVIEPRTPLGERLHRAAVSEPWTLTLAEWVPSVLGFGLAFEVVEAIVVFAAFARRMRRDDSLARENP